jgi:hypothetical protein
VHVRRDGRAPGVRHRRRIAQVLVTLSGSSQTIDCNPLRLNYGFVVMALPPHPIAHRGPNNFPDHRRIVRYTYRTLEHRSG